MTEAELRELREALSLAAVSYRGFADPKIGESHDAALARGIRAGLRLPELGGLLDDWELAWGPASYRAPLSGVDDVTAYVVRGLARSDRYALVIRGTNPVSLFDWLFGDLWVARTVPWPHANVPGAAISLSTALGLAILRGLRAGPPADRAAPSLWDRLPESLKTATHSFAGSLTRVEELLVGGLRQRLRDERLSLSQLAADGAPRLDVPALVAHWMPGRVRESLGRLDRLLDGVRGVVDLELLALLEGEAAVVERFGSGVTLGDFFAAAAESSERGVDLAVVGHSKGGALAATAALWLSDTQGTADGWDPGRESRVRCISFAGPTAGNAAFASHSDRALGERMTRVRNPLDIVPRAWDGLASVPGLYGPSDPLLQDLVKRIRESVAPIGYTQISSPPHDLDSKVRNLPFASQVTYQHLEAYLAALRIDPGPFDFFNPLA
jgi:hypothetical protein